MSQPPAPSKRNRTQLSCITCRHGKLKCDRQSPCSQCLKRGRASQCTFPEPVPRRKAGASMRDRVRHLEGLVKGVMGEKALERENGEGEGPGGQVLIDKGESTYVGATHWAAIMEDIEEVKDYFANVDSPLAEEEETGELKAYTMLAFSPHPVATREGVLGRLPERGVVDRLVARYFNSQSPALHLLHKPTFQNQYKRFWAAPNEAPVSYIALLYALMALATFAALGAGETVPDTRGTPMELVRTYRECCMHSLILSHYTRPGPYTIETLIMYLEGEFLISEDDQVHLYLLIGNVVRLGLRMGLHRDATKVGGNITVYEAEMRRRLWHHLGQIDLLGSFHIGLPGMFESIESDTMYPSNLRDEDWGEDSLELPPSRPETEFTPTSYLICKSRLVHVCAKISAFANRLTLPHLDEVIEMDKILHQAYEKVPSFYQMPRSEFSIFEAPEMIIKQFSLALVYQKSRCMLHRKYIMKEGDSEQYMYSKSAALDSALELLRCQHMSYEAAQPGGPLSRDRWVLSTLSMHDFLLASMIVCINIIQSAEGDSGVEPEAKPNYMPDQKLMAALEKSYRIFMDSREYSAGAKKASALLRAMLNKVNRALGRPSLHHQETSSETLHPDRKAHTKHTISNLSLSDLSPDFLATSDVPDYNLWQNRASGPATASSSSEMFFDPSHGPVSALPGNALEEMIEIPNNIDWDTFDNHVFPGANIYETWPNFSPGDLPFNETDPNIFDQSTL